MRSVQSDEPLDAAGETVGVPLPEEIGSLALVIRPSARKRKRLEYPEETEDSRLAARVRKLESKLTPEEETEHFRRVVEKVHGRQLAVSQVCSCWAFGARA